ncbi:hypothetical protein EUA59_00885 [TM7 phylum sp. oral taxon 346]|nr:hypothetical protein EUA59_00885 [TM7 phylum sp. oral taxon 346]
MSRDPEHHKPDKENLEREKERILDRDEFIGGLASTIGGITESTYGGVVDHAIIDFNTVDYIFTQLAEDREYRPSDEEVENNPRIGEVWEQTERMRSAVTDPQSSDQAEGYRSILDDLASRAKDIVSSRRDAAAKAAKDAAKLAASIGMPTRTPDKFAPGPTAIYPYSPPTAPPTPDSNAGGPKVSPDARTAPPTPDSNAGGPKVSPDARTAPPTPDSNAGGPKVSPDARTAPPTPDSNAGTGGEGLQQMLARKDELLNEILALAINGGDQAEIKRLGLELADLVKRMTSGSETSATRATPPPAPQPTSSTRGARQTRPSPQPGGTPGGPGRPGTPPPASPVPPSSPGGPGRGRPGRPAPRTPDHNAGQPKTLEQEKEDLQKRLAEIDKELDAPYAAKLDEYARLLAKEESKRADGGFRFSIMHWVGGPGKNRKREKRREALDEAGKALKKEVLAYLRQKVETKRQNGEYQGTDDEIAQQMSDEMFDEQRKIFGQRLQERKDEILRSESDKLRNRILAKIGSWIGMEKSTKNSLKAAAVGVGHGLVKGAAVGALTGLFGVTWPISVGVSIVAAAVGDRMIRRGVRLDAIRQGLGGQNGSRQLVDDDKFARIKEKAEGKKRSQEFMADKMLKLSRKDSYAAGDRLSKETDERIGKHKVALGIGRVAGGAVGGLGGRWVGQQLHDHTPVGQAVDSAKRNVHEFIHREDTAAAAAEREYQGKIDELNRRIDELNNRLERAAAGNIDNSGSFSNWEYPWDWAVDQFGENNAISKLYELADAAARDGHNIQWHGYGDTQWLSIDGNSDTATVLETLAKYMKDNYGLAA